MNEFFETPKEVTEVKTMQEIKECTSDYDSPVENWEEYVESMNEYAESFESRALAVKEYSTATVEAREYKLDECTDVAKKHFTAEVINNWINMDVETRDQIIQDYAKDLSEALGIDFNEVIWEVMPPGEGYIFGYNNGDGHIHLNIEMLSDPAMLMYIVDTTAHELRHQFQNEAIENPDKFPIDEETIKEWTIGRNIYTQNMPTAYDPWGYTYNPMETDARFFGESMVREITKDIINA